MKAVILAETMGGGLRPRPCAAPLPMLPLLGRPVLEHSLGLLRGHGITRACVVLGRGEEKLREAFGDGQALGVELTYVVREGAGGSAGAVKACGAYLEGEDFLVLPGDVVCDFDLTAAIELHRERQAQATLLLCPLSAAPGHVRVVMGRDGRVERFAQPPCRDQVLTSMADTGLYLFSHRVLEKIPGGECMDLGRDLLPRLLGDGVPVYGCPGGGYWQGLHDWEDHLNCAADALSGKVCLDPGLPQRGPGVWSAAPLPQDVTVVPPCWIGEGVELGRGSLIGPHVVLERGSAVGPRSLVQRSVLFPGARAAERTTLYGAVLCENARADCQAVLNEGVVLGEHAIAEEGAILMEGVRLWSGQTAPAGSRLIHSVTPHGPTGVVRFGDGGVIRGTLGEELGPELLMSIGSALGAWGRVALGYNGGMGARMLAQAAASGVTAAGGTALSHDLECPAQGAWLAQSYGLNVSLFIQQEGERVFLHFFDRDGLSLGRARERRLEHVLRQGPSLRVGAGRVGETEHLQVKRSDWEADVVRRARLRGPFLRALTVAVPGERPEERGLRNCLSLLGCRVTDHWERGIPAFGAEHGGFYLTAQDERGALLEPEQLLPLLCLIEMENGGGKVAVPDGASAAADLVAAGFGGTCLRLGRDGQRARELYAGLPWLWDAASAAVRILSRMALTGEKLEGLMAKTPRFAARKREVPLTADRGRVMWELAREHRRALEGDGLRLRAGNGWVYLTPLARRQALRVVAESPDMELAAELCDLYVGRVLRADRRAGCREEN